MKRLWQRLSRREKALVSLAVTALVLVLGRYLLLDPFLERREWVRGQIEIQPEQLAKNLRYLAQKKEIEEGLERVLGELKSMTAVLLPGDTPPVSASNLQEVLQNAAAKDGVQVITTRVLSPESLGPFTRIPIQVEVAGQLEQVANLIKSLESEQKMLVINEVNLRSLFVPAASRAQLNPGAPVQQLRASLVISGIARIQAPSPSGERASAKSSEGNLSDKSAGSK
jgi:Tfp pilus assembly protein PilO